MILHVGHSVPRVLKHHKVASEITESKISPRTVAWVIAYAIFQAESVGSGKRRSVGGDRWKGGRLYHNNAQSFAMQISTACLLKAIDQ